MYEKHFGLQKRPFTARATGADVFVGPQTAVTMAGLKKALQSQDAVIAVSGPAGVGKSTLVGKALDAVADTHRSVRIGRMSLDGADALEFLLEELGMTDLPRGTIRQFAALREKLGHLQNEGKRLVIVVEDAILTGVDTMAEFEALTAADAGESGGAAIVVMGDERLRSFLQEPQLARLAQRVRQRQEITPLSPAELRGYLAHCFRRAGGAFEAIFDADAAVAIHDLCGGNPRVANTVVDAALAAAAASGQSPLSSKFIADVAASQLGLELSHKPPVAAAAVSREAPEPAPEPTEQADPVIVFSDEAPDDLLADEDIPELIQDTLPDLEILAPDIMERDAAPEPEPEPVLEAEPVPEPAPEPEPEPEVELEAELEAEPVPEPAAERDPVPQLEAASAPDPLPVAETAADDVPEWERDPTMAELRPDLEALEKAMAFAHGDEDAEPPVLEPVTEPDAKQAPADIEEIPEITLDNAIQQRIENIRIDQPGPTTTTDDAQPAAAAKGNPDMRIDENEARKADLELEKIAAELAKAKTIEDVDDKLAETLFGEEFNLVAARVVATGPSQESANDERLSLFDTGAATMAQSAGTPVVEGMPLEEPAVEVSLATQDDDAEAGLDLSASQRLRTVRALNSDARPSREHAGNGADTGDNVPAQEVANPEPIEDQINTSMTQTLKALNVSPPVSSHAAADPSDDDEEEKSGGFFSRFRRS